MSARGLWLFLTLYFLASCSDEAPVAEKKMPTVTITEWVVPYEESRPRDPFVESPNKIWFVGQRTGYLAYFNPETEEFTQIMLEKGSGPHNIIVDDEGVAWYAGNVMGWIGRITPDGSLTTIPMPLADARDPHTLVEDGRGNIWFTVQGGNFIGRLNKTTLAVDLVHVSTSNARPYGIDIDSSGRPWVALFGTNKLATVEPNTLQLHEISLPRESARPRRNVITSDDAVWYVDYEEGYLGRYNNKDNNFKEWATPAGINSKPYGMAVDSQDRIWFVETGSDPNRLVGFDTHEEKFFTITPIASGAGTVRNMMFHAPTNTIWFGTDKNTLGRVTLP